MSGSSVGAVKILIFSAAIIAAIFISPNKLSACTLGLWGSDCAVWGFLFNESRAAQPTAAPQQSLSVEEQQSQIDSINARINAVRAVNPSSERIQELQAERMKLEQEFDKPSDPYAPRGGLFGASAGKNKFQLANEYRDALNLGFPKAVVDARFYAVMDDGPQPAVLNPAGVKCADELGVIDTSCYMKELDNFERSLNSTQTPASAAPTSWPELPESAYARTTPAKCFLEYDPETGEPIDNEGCLEKQEQLQKQAEALTLEAGLGTRIEDVIGMPARKDAPDPLYDITTDRDVWCAEYDENGVCSLYRSGVDYSAIRDAERAQQDQAISSGLGGGYLNLFKRDEEDPQSLRRDEWGVQAGPSAGSGWDPIGAITGFIKRFFGAEEQVPTFSQPYNPNLESWRGMKLDDSVQTLYTLEELDSQTTGAPQDAAATPVSAVQPEPDYLYLDAVNPPVIYPGGYSRSYDEGTDSWIDVDPDTLQTTYDQVW